MDNNNHLETLLTPQSPVAHANSSNNNSHHPETAITATKNNNTINTVVTAPAAAATSPTVSALTSPRAPATPRMLKNATSRNSISDPFHGQNTSHNQNSVMSPVADSFPQSTATAPQQYYNKQKQDSLPARKPQNLDPLNTRFDVPNYEPQQQQQQSHQQQQQQPQEQQQQQQFQQQQQQHHSSHSGRHKQQQIYRKSIGDWDFVKTVGAGSMGKVKLAKHRRTHELCAVKIVIRAAKAYQRAHVDDPPPKDAAEYQKRLKEYEKEEARDKRTIREATLGKLLYHPYICRLYEMLPMSNHYYMLFEFVSGGQMLDYIVNHGSLRESQARKFARGIASALDYCHRNNVVHRDLKIENIMINDSGDIKIIDFGLSNLYNSKKFLYTYCGSLYFAAPELLSAHPYVGPEVDIWSFGIILYVLVSGKVPFDDKSVSILHKKIKNGHVEYPSTLSVSCLDLLTKMIVVNPANRASLKHILSHPWMNENYEFPPRSYVPFREPLQLPLDLTVLQDLEKYDLGNQDYTYPELTKILTSPEYKLASQKWYSKHAAYESRQVPEHLRDYSDDVYPDVTNAYHPLISMYYLVKEMRARHRAKQKQSEQQQQQLTANKSKPAPINTSSAVVNNNNNNNNNNTCPPMSAPPQTLSHSLSLPTSPPPPQPLPDSNKMFNENINTKDNNPKAAEGLTTDNNNSDFPMTSDKNDSTVLAIPEQAHGGAVAAPFSVNVPPQNQPDIISPRRTKSMALGNNYHTGNYDNAVINNGNQEPRSSATPASSINGLIRRLSSGVRRSTSTSSSMDSNGNSHNANAVSSPTGVGMMSPTSPSHQQYILDKNAPPVPSIPNVLSYSYSNDNNNNNTAGIDDLGLKPLENAHREPESTLGRSGSMSRYYNKNNSGNASESGNVDSTIPDNNGYTFTNSVDMMMNTTSPTAMQQQQFPQVAVAKRSASNYYNNDVNSGNRITNGVPSGGNSISKGRHNRTVSASAAQYGRQNQYLQQSQQYQAQQQSKIQGYADSTGVTSSSNSGAILSPRYFSSGAAANNNNNGLNISRKTSVSSNTPGIFAAARSKTIGHGRSKSIGYKKSPYDEPLSANNEGSSVPPLPDLSTTAVMSYNSNNNHVIDGFKPLSEAAIVEQAKLASPGSMPSIQFPKTLYIKGFFSVQTTSTKPPPVIRQNIIDTLLKFGISFEEVKGGFSCTYITPTVTKAISTSAGATGISKSITNNSDETKNISSSASTGTDASENENAELHMMNTNGTSTTITASNSVKTPPVLTVNADAHDTSSLGSGGNNSIVTTFSQNNNNVATTPPQHKNNGHRRMFSMGFKKQSSSQYLSQQNAMPATPKMPTTPAVLFSPANMEHTRSTSGSVHLDGDSSASLESFSALGASDMIISSRVAQNSIGNVNGDNSGQHGQANPKRSPIHFEIYIVKIPFLSLYGVQLKKLSGNAWNYKTLADNILSNLNL